MNLRKRRHNIIKIALVLLGLLALTGVQAKEKITYYEHDAFGNIIAATDENGEILWKEHYDPYGNRLTRDQAAGDNRIWYTGHQETDFGLIYMGARHYDPTTGRFLSVDPLDFKEKNIQSFSRYAYANNNPYAYLDPDGREAVYGTFYLQSAYHEAHTKAVELWGSYFVKTSVIVGSSAVAPEAAVATKLSPYMARLLGLRVFNRGREIVETRTVQSGRKLGDYLQGQRGALGESPPTLKPIHSKETITSGSNRYSYNYWSKQSTDDIVKSLRPGETEALRIKPDGRIMNGNTRTTILQERGFNINSLPREVLR